MKWWPIDGLLPKGTPMPFAPPHLIRKALSQVPFGMEVGVPLDLSDPDDEGLWSVAKDWWVTAAETKTSRLSVKFRRSGKDALVMVVSLTRVPPVATPEKP